MIIVIDPISWILCEKNNQIQKRMDDEWFTQVEAGKKQRVEEKWEKKAWNWVENAYFWEKETLVQT